jgi:hypothetical protein
MGVCISDALNYTIEMEKNRAKKREKDYNP